MTGFATPQCYHRLLFWHGTEIAWLAGIGEKVMSAGSVLTSAAAIVATPIRRGSVSISITAKVLGTIGLLLADRTEIVLADVADCGPRSYDMATRPIRLDTLTGDTTVLVRAVGVGGSGELMVAVRLEFNDPHGGSSLVLDHDFGDVGVTEQTPLAAMPLPVRQLRGDL
jgi:hypothetical protein